MTQPADPRRRFAEPLDWAMLVSVLLHALLLALRFGTPGAGAEPPSPLPLTVELPPPAAPLPPPLPPAPQPQAADVPMPSTAPLAGPPNELTVTLIHRAVQQASTDEPPIPHPVHRKATRTHTRKPRLTAKQGDWKLDQAKDAGPDGPAALIDAAVGKENIDVSDKDHPPTSEPGDPTAQVSTEENPATESAPAKQSGDETKQVEQANIAAEAAKREADAAAKAEEVRKAAEAQAQAEQRKADEAAKAEQARIAAEQLAAEAKRKADEQASAEQARLAAAAKQQAEEKAKQEQARQMAEQQAAERQRADAARAEQARLAAEAQKRADEQIRQEQERKAAEAQATRQRAEEQARQLAEQAAQQKAEAQAQAEQARRLAEAQAAAERQRAAEQARIERQRADEQARQAAAAAEQARAEQARKAAEAQAAAERQRAKDQARKLAEAERQRNQGNGVGSGSAASGIGSRTGGLSGTGAGGSGLATGPGITVPIAPPGGLGLAERALQQLHRGSQLNEQLPRMRVAKLNQPATAADIEFRFYSESWRLKIERVGGFNAPHLDKDRYYNPMLVSIVINSDGTLASVVIQQSSGDKRLDDAARRIVESSAPFSPFPPGMKARYDQVEITRTWNFVNGATNLSY